MAVNRMDWFPWKRTVVGGSQSFLGTALLGPSRGSERRSSLIGRRPEGVATPDTNENKKKMMMNKNKKKKKKIEKKKTPIGGQVFFLLHHLQRRLVNRRSPKPSFFFLFIFLKKNFSFFLAVTPKNVDFELLRAVVVFVCFRLDANGSRFDSIRFVFFLLAKGDSLYRRASSTRSKLGKNSVRLGRPW